MIHNVSLNDCLDGTQPPEQVLTLGALDDTVFVSICSVEQDSHKETRTEIAEISVSLPSLIEALLALAADQEREHLRPVDNTGQAKETRLAGRRLTVAPASGISAVGAVTQHLRYTSWPKAGDQHEGSDGAEQDDDPKTSP